MLLLVGHGDQVGDDRNAALRATAAAIARAFGGRPVQHAVLNGEPTVAEAVGRLVAEARDQGRREPLTVYPMFMSDGYFTRVKLPKTLAEAGHPDARILPPIGLDPLLINVMDQRLGEAATRVGLAPNTARVLMAAHGSRSGEPASRRAAEAAAAALTAHGWTLDTAFIEEAPRFADVLAERTPDIVIGFFAGLGTHAVNDVAGLAEETDGVRAIIPSIGIDPLIADLVQRRLAEAESLTHPIVAVV